MATDLALSEKALAVINDIESVVESCSLMSLVDAKSMTRAFMMAKGMQQLRELLTDEMMVDVMSIMNTPLGFKTDRDPSKKQWSKAAKKYEFPEPYPVEVVRDCVIQALLRNLQLCGNEFNIISGQCYTTREGLSRLVREFPGLSNLVTTCGVPVMVNENVARVPFSASWKLDGHPHSLVGAEKATDADGHDIDTRIPVRINAGMGADAVLGKAERKMLARIYSKISGTEQLDDEPDKTIEAKTDWSDMPKVKLPRPDSTTSPELDDAISDWKTARDLGEALAACETSEQVAIVYSRFSAQCTDDDQKAEVGLACKDREEELTESVTVDGQLFETNEGVGQ